MHFIFVEVIECVPAIVAKLVSEAVTIPVIGIGSGPHTHGQVLVYHDLLGIIHHPHYEKHVPSFCKRYAKLGKEIDDALSAFKTEVHEGIFPGILYSPYKMSNDEEQKLLKLLAVDEAERMIETEKLSRKLKELDEYEITKLY